VADAYARAEAASFELSCDPEVGKLLCILAGAVPAGGRILELGTGVGVGLAWIVHGLGDRTDVEVVTVEIDPAIHRVAKGTEWPGYVRFELGDAAASVSKLGAFELIFPDAPAGKLYGIGRTIEALAPRGVLIVDDMDLEPHGDPELRAALVKVRARLLSRSDLLVAELDLGSGVMLAVRR
jgi:demethylmenaquinone methyltransferase/2-methoxy-6-polyprenyl-1,4-benzoquinol methylase